MYGARKAHKIISKSELLCRHNNIDIYIDGGLLACGAVCTCECQRLEEHTASIFSTFHRKFGTHIQVYIASQPTKLASKFSQP